MVIRIVPTPYINAQANYLLISLGHAAHAQVTTVTDSLCCSRYESGDVITFTTQLNKTADCAKNVQNSPTVASFVELSRVGRRDRGYMFTRVAMTCPALGPARVVSEILSMLKSRTRYRTRTRTRTRIYSIHTTVYCPPDSIPSCEHHIDLKVASIDRLRLLW